MFKAKFVVKHIYLFYILFIVATAATEGKESNMKAFAETSAIGHRYLKHVAIVSYGGKHCGGVILTTKAILTAAKCVTNDGSQALRQKDIVNAKICVGTPLINCKSPTAQVRNVQNVFVHINFVELEFVNDIAIFILRQDLVENGGTVQHIHLADRKTPAGTNCTIIGWGDSRCDRKRYQLPEEAQFTTLHIMSESYCEKFAPAANLTPEFCALDSSKNAKSCRGDTGSPLICNGKAIGIMSWTTTNAKYPNYFTDVLYYREWINTILEQLYYEARSVGLRLIPDFLCTLCLSCVFKFFLCRLR